MKKVNRVFLALSCLMMAGTVSAQDEVEVGVSGDLVSSYVWRGCKLDDAAVQPSLEVSYKGLSLSAWASYGITSPDAWKEIDLSLSYKVGNFSVGVTDYWVGQGKYFLYKKDETTHIWEANLGYDFGPVSFQWNTNFAGADAVTDKGKRSYSSYVELNAPFRLGGVDWTATVGIVPYDADNGCYYTNSKNLAVTNIALMASKDIKLTDTFSVPVFTQVVANPSIQAFYLAFGVTLKP